MNSWKIGRFFGIDVFIHWSFWLLPAFVLLSQNGLGEPARGVFLLGILGAAFACVLLHEFGHALAARGYGIGTRDITLYPIGGVARLESMGRKPWQEFWIAVAGPAVNVVIVLLLGAVLFAGFTVDAAWAAHSPEVNFLMVLLAINLGMIFFNLLPAFPLDGGRVLRALLSLGLGKLRATRIAAGVGAVLAWIIAIGGAVFLGNWTLLIIGLFVYLAGQQELQAVEREEQLGHVQPFVLSPAAPEDEETLPTLEPKITVFVWDPHTGLWVRQKSERTPWGSMLS